MPIQHNAVVDVEHSGDGEPFSFRWGHDRYFVIGMPMRFYRRRGPWWHLTRIEGRVDVEIWRVEAAPEGGEGRSFDLRRESGEQWTLELEWE